MNPWYVLNRNGISAENSRPRSPTKNQNVFGPVDSVGVPYLILYKSGCVPSKDCPRPLTLSLLHTSNPNGASIHPQFNSATSSKGGGTCYPPPSSAIANVDSMGTILFWVRPGSIVGHLLKLIPIVDGLLGLAMQSISSTLPLISPVWSNSSPRTESHPSCVVL